MSEALSVTPEPAVANSVKTCNSEVNHSGNQFQHETFGDIEPQTDHISTTPVSKGMQLGNKMVIIDG